MKRIISLAVVFLLTMTGMTALFALTIDGSAPQLGPAGDPVVDAIQEELDSAFEREKTSYEDEIRGISPNPKKMIGAFATSSVFSSIGASLRTFQGYDSFALTVGVMGGVQLPASIFSVFGSLDAIANAADKLLDDINKDGDLQMGVNPQVINAQLGINTSGFLLKGLYVGFKGGYMNLPINLDEFQMSFLTWSAGAMINYQVIPQFKLMGGLIVWRGLNVGAGFVYQSTSLNLDIPIKVDDGSSSGQTTIGSTGAYLDFGNPKLSFRFNINTYTVPLEAVTSIRLLGFANFSFGCGADLGFGSATMSGSLDSEINIRNLPSGMTQSPGRMNVSMSGTNSPSLINPKIMGSLAFSAGPAIILDIPITYYFLNNGYNIGITFGIAM